MPGSPFLLCRPSLPKGLFQYCWIGVCATAMLTQTRLLLGIDPAPGLFGAFVFCGTIFGYHFASTNRLSRRLAWALGGIGGLFFLCLSSAAQISLCVPIFFFAAYYGLQTPGNAGLRGHLWAKPTTIALAWTWVTVLLPALPILAVHKNAIILMMAERAAFVFALALAYDVADVRFDQTKGLSTFPVRYGVSDTLRFMAALLALSAVFIVLNSLLGTYSRAIALTLLVSLLLSGGVLHWLNGQKKYRYWHKIAVDALMVAQGGLVWWVFRVRCS